VRQVSIGRAAVPSVASGMRCGIGLFGALTLLPALLAAQGGTVRGVVQDSAGRGMANADVVATPGPHRVRTDSVGRFVLAGIGGGKFVLHARKLGYSPGEATADLHGDGSVDVTLVLDHRMANLDTVVVRADGSCPDRSLDGWVCRKARGDKGVFMDYLDIDDKDPLTTADLYRDIPGFRVDVRPTRTGNRRVPVPNGLHCMISLVDGRPATAANFVPDLPWDLLALEVYPSATDVPKEYQRYVNEFSRGERCGVAIYWDQFAKLSSK
jgi:hypothetical protein